MRKNPHAVALGRLGGRVGGHARAAKLSPEQRQEIARRAAMARWAKARASAGESNGRCPVQVAVGDARYPCILEPGHEGHHRYLPALRVTR